MKSMLLEGIVDEIANGWSRGGIEKLDEKIEAYRKSNKNSKRYELGRTIGIFGTMSALAAAGFAAYGVISYFSN